MKKYVLLFLVTGLAKASFSQTDSLYFAATLDTRTPTEASDPLFNGREHVNYHPSIEGNPYYFTTDWQKGNLVYRDILYKDVFLKYDLAADEVVVRHINGFTGVVLFTPRIRTFTLGDKLFVTLAGDDRSVIKTGLYEQLVKGNLSLYARRSRLLEEKIVSAVLEQKFVNNDSYYLLKEGKYYPVKKESALLELTGERRGEIKAWMKASGIKFKKNREAAMVSIVEHYNQLSR